MAGKARAKNPVKGCSSPVSLAPAPPVPQERPSERICGTAKRKMLRAGKRWRPWWRMLARRAKCKSRRRVPRVRLLYVRPRPATHHVPLHKATPPGLQALHRYHRRTRTQEPTTRALQAVREHACRARNPPGALRLPPGHRSCRAAQAQHP